PYSGTTPELIDDLVYNYTGNRLDKITLPSGTVNNASGYNALENTITYNANGSMINQWDKNIASIDYNHLNLPRLFTTGSGKFKQTIAYNYRADGVKIGKNTAGRFFLSTNTDYLDGFQYQVSLVAEGDDSSNFLQFVPTSEGYFDFRQNKYIYNYTDHLGNVRLSYFNNGSGLEVLEENNYYPFGLKHRGYNELAGNTVYQYKYNGKELQTETGMYDYGARFYMPDIGRWGVVDEKAEKYRRWSSYTYAVNDPINAIDPDGRDIIYVAKDGTNLQYRKGHFYFLNGDLKGQMYDGRKHSVSTTLFRLARAYSKIEHSKDNALKGILHQLENSENIHQIQERAPGKGSTVFTNRENSAKDYQGEGSVTFYDFSPETKKRFKETAGVNNSDLSIVTHEMSHQLDEDNNNTADDQYPNSASDPSEIRAVHTENKARIIDGLPSRTNYCGEKIDNEKLNNPPNYILPGQKIRDEQKKATITNNRIY
uniref:RHS repeat-associated core domain-containing protein n=1 Tax=uncultured Chryseobacterium sp. TaxID=259322 RepID=UPI0025DB15AD